MLGKISDYADRIKGDTLYRGDPSNLVNTFPHDYYYWSPEEMLEDSETVDIYCKRTDGQKFDLEDMDSEEAFHFYIHDRNANGSFQISGKKLAVWLSDGDLKYRYKSKMRKKKGVRVTSKTNKFVARGTLEEDVEKEEAEEMLTKYAISNNTEVQTEYNPNTEKEIDADEAIQILEEGGLETAEIFNNQTGRYSLEKLLEDPEIQPSEARIQEQNNEKYKVDLDILIGPENIKEEYRNKETVELEITEPEKDEKEPETQLLE